MRFPLICLAALLAGCTASSDARYAAKGPKTGCIANQVFDLGKTFRDAASVCGPGLPDLTGRSDLQQVALSQNVPFTIRPRADAEIKRRDQSVIVGSLIPGSPETNRNNPESTPFFPLVVSSGVP